MARFKSEDRLRKKVYCVQLYYGKYPGLQKSLTQADIAKRLGVSNSQVSQLLREAQQEGIIEVSLNAPRALQLEGELVMLYGRYGLRQSRVAVVAGNSEEIAAMDAIGSVAAQYLETYLKPKMRVGISGGRTIGKMTEHLHAGKLKDLSIFPLESRGPITVSANTLTAIIAGKCDGQVKAYALPVPTLTNGSLEETTKIIEYLLSLDSIAEVYEGMRNLDVAIIGISCLSAPNSKKWTAEYYGVDTSLIENLSQKAVGNTLWQFFDKQGNIVESDLHKRTITIPMAQLAEMRRDANKEVIVLAGTIDKVPAIRGAILGGFIDTLITDINAAEALVEVGV
jgi:DNA-binding transcriptional regulator LsrR (DeoR family)